MPQPATTDPLTLQRFADWLWSSRGEVIEAWSAAVRGDPRIQTDRSLSYADFVDHIPSVLEEICNRLRGASPEEGGPRIRSEARQHGFLRWRQGYDLAELMHEMGHLRQVLVGFVDRGGAAIGLSPPALIQLVRLTSQVLHEGQVSTVLSHVAERDRELGERDREIARRDDALQTSDRRLQQALLEQERRRVEALEAAARAKDEFLATLSHEMRTPLTPILAWVTVLERTSVPAPVERAVATIGRNARVLGQLINDLLDVSRIVSGKLELARETLDARVFVRAAHDTLQFDADLREVRLVLREPAGPVPVTGDATRLQQIVWNLLSNAVKFSRPGDEVTVEVQTDSGLARVLVTDRGVGIEPEFLPHIFDRFSQQDQRSTRGHGGLGLGLAIARAIAEAHGGRLTATSAGPDAGAQFELQLPLADDRRDPP